MYPRSRSKAFRNAILRTWWLPLLLVVGGGGGWYSHEKNQPEEWIAAGKIVVALPGGQAPDEVTMQAHVSLLESPTIAEQAAANARLTNPEATLPKDPVVATSEEGGFIHVIATGPEESGTKFYLNESLAAYITSVESMRHTPSSAGEKLNRSAVPTILELAGMAVMKEREQMLATGVVALASGTVGFLLMLLISSLWAIFRPASTQPSLGEIAKAASGLDATRHAVLVEWLRGQLDRDVPGHPMA